MTVRLSIHHKAEQELYKLERGVKAAFFDFSHRFRANPDHPGLDLKPLKGNSELYRAKLGQSHRLLLTKIGADAAGNEDWLVVAVRHRKDVYEELTVAVNRVTGEIEFVDLSVVGDGVLRKAGVTLTPSEPETVSSQEQPVPPPTQPLLVEVTEAQLRELGVAEALIGPALAVSGAEEFDRLISSAPRLSAEVLSGLGAGMTVAEVRAEVTAPVEVALTDDYAADLSAALARTPVTTVDDDIEAVLAEGDFRAWKVFLHPTQVKAARRDFNGPARVSGGPGTGKTIVALHRVKYLLERLPSGQDAPILLTTFTKNLTADLRARLSSLLEPEQMARVEIANIDQLAARVVAEHESGARRRITDAATTQRLADLVAELDEHRWDARFLFEEWDQVILGQALTSRKEYFEVRRAGRGRALTRPDRAAIWKIIEQFSARLDKDGVQTWGQFADRAARLAIESTKNRPARYRHIVIDEAQDLRAAHWKMLRALVQSGRNDMFIAADTYQRIYDHQVALGALGVNIRGRSTRLTLSYRSTRQILASATQIVTPAAAGYDNLDDGAEPIDGYRSVLRGPKPELRGFPSWQQELAGLVTTVQQWRDELAADPRGTIAICAADRGLVTQVIDELAKAGISCAELTKDGPKGDGDIHVGTMHRMKGLEYQRVAIVAVTDGVIPRRVADYDPDRAARRDRRDRSLLFVAATRARDTLRMTWHQPPSPYVPNRLET